MFFFVKTVVSQTEVDRLIFVPEGDNFGLGYRTQDNRTNAL